jgi:hypothetical protein
MIKNLNRKESKVAKLKNIFISSFALKVLALNASTLQLNPFPASTSPNTWKTGLLLKKPLKYLLFFLRVLCALAVQKLFSFSSVEI